jgi:hypothetical protein
MDIKDAITSQFPDGKIEAMKTKTLIASIINESPRDSRILNKYIEFMSNLMTVESISKEAYTILDSYSVNNVKAICELTHPKLYEIEMSKGILLNYDTKTKSSDTFLVLIKSIIDLLSLMKKDISETDSHITTELNTIRVLYCIDKYKNGGDRK